MRSKRTCSIDGCEKAYASRGWCNMHWLRWYRNGDPLAVTIDLRRGQPLADRLWAHVEKDGPGGCWEWTGKRDADGYGHISLEGGRKKGLTHRVAWILTHGPIPDETPFVLHRCDNPPCCNPFLCLFLGTKEDNARDMAAKGRWRNGQSAGIGASG